ncbi:MAG: hypothetical protein MHM6MM_003658 [Cercozoa sp. M6MM]
MTVKSVDAASFVEALAKHLKSTAKITPPAYVDLIKTGTHREMPPIDPDWFYTRAAAIARRIYVRKDAGVGTLAKVFGDVKRNGVRRNHHRDAARGLIRNILKQLETADIVCKTRSGVRRVSKNGQRELDTIAAQVPSTQLFSRTVAE